MYGRTTYYQTVQVHTAKSHHMLARGRTCTVFQLMKMADNDDNLVFCPFIRNMGAWRLCCIAFVCGFYCRINGNNKRKGGKLYLQAIYNCAVFGEPIWCCLAYMNSNFKYELQNMREFWCLSLENMPNEHAKNRYQTIRTERANEML